MSIELPRIGTGTKGVAHATHKYGITSVQCTFTFVHPPGWAMQRHTACEERLDSIFVNTKADALTNVQAIAFDLDGTLYLQGTPLPGAVTLLHRLKSRNIPYVFMTNNSSVSKATYVQKLTALGGTPDPAEILTSNDVMVHHLLQGDLRRPYLLATTEVREEYASLGLVHTEDDPDCVLLTFDMELTFERIARASAFIAKGLPYFATHPDVTCPIPGGFLPDAGSFIEMFAAATGRRPTILGKPNEATVEAITARLGLPAKHIAFVGDRLTTDIAMGISAGFVSVLTLTGVTTAGEAVITSHKPTLTVSGMPEFTELLTQAGIL